MASEALCQLNQLVDDEGTVRLGGLTSSEAAHVYDELAQAVSALNCKLFNLGQAVMELNKQETGSNAPQAE